jgi:hypothetical protein
MIRNLFSFCAGIFMCLTMVQAQSFDVKNELGFTIGDKGGSALTAFKKYQLLFQNELERGEKPYPVFFMYNTAILNDAVLGAAPRNGGFVVEDSSVALIQLMYAANDFSNFVRPLLKKIDSEPIELTDYEGMDFKTEWHYGEALQITATKVKGEEIVNVIIVDPKKPFQY